MRYLILLVLILGSLVAKESFVNVSYLEPSSKKIEFTFANNFFDKDKIGHFSNESLIDCSGLSGTFEFSSLNKLTLYLDNSLAKEHKCKLDSKIFKKSNGYSFDIFSDLFRVKNISIKSKFITMDFNDIVESEALKNNLKLIYRDKIINFEFSKESSSKRFTIVLDREYDSINLTISKSLKSKTGLLLESDYKKELKTTISKPIDLTKKKSFIVKDIESYPKKNSIYSNIRAFYLADDYYVNFQNSKMIQVEPKVDFFVRDAGYRYYKREKIYHKSFDLIGNFEPNREYKVTFKKSLSTYKSSVKKSSTFNIKTSDSKPYILFKDNKNRLADRYSLELESSNLNQIKVIVDKLLDENYRYYINFSFAKTYYFSKYSKVLYSRYLALDSKKNSKDKNYLDLSEFIDKSGVYRVRLFDDNSKKFLTEKVIYISDIAINAKISNNQVFIYLKSLKNSKPVSDAEIRLYSKTNQILKLAFSDSDGILKLDNFDTENLLSIVAKKDNDKSFLLLKNQIDGSNYYKNENYRAFINFERKIAKPDDEISFSILVKNGDFKSLSNRPVKLIIKNPTNDKIVNEVIDLDRLGNYQKKLKIENFFKTGRYSVNIYFKNRLIGQDSFMVESFTPNRIKSAISLDRESYFIDESIKAKIESKYLFGAKAKGLKARAKLSIQKGFLKNDKYRDFRFTTGDKKEFRYKESYKNFILNSEGKADIIFKPEFEIYPDFILNALLEVRVFEGGKPLSKYENFNIYPSKELVGIKLLSKDEKEFKFQAVIINPITGVESKRELDLDIFRISHNYDSYSNSFKESIQKVKSIKVGELFNFSPELQGEYRFILRDSLFGSSTEIDASLGYYRYSNFSTNMSVGIKAKKQVSKDEVLKIDINSPILGKALITYENNRVLKYRFLDIDRLDFSFEEKIDFSDEDFFIKCYIFRDLNSKERVLPLRVFGKKLIKVKNPKYDIDAQIDAKFENSKIEIDIKSNESGKKYLYLTLVDSGVLSIVGNNLNVIDFFKTKTLNSVKSFDFYNQVITNIIDSKDLAFGGDGVSHLARKKFLSPKAIKKSKKPFSKFLGLIEFENSFKTAIDRGDFIGEVTLLAFIFDDKKADIKSKKLKISDDIAILEPKLKFVRESDKFIYKIDLINNLAKELDLKLNLEFKNLESKESSFNLNLLPNESKSLDLNLKAISGLASIDLEIEYLNKSIKKVISFPIYEIDSLISETLSNEISNTQNLYLKDNEKADLTISNSQKIEFKRVYDYLKGYPYGCLEQIVSKTFANYYSKDRYREDFIRDSVLKIASNRVSSFNFSYWQNSKKINKFASIYALDLLLFLKDYNSIFDRAKIVKFLEKSLRKESTFLKYYIGYILARESALKKSDFNYLLDSKEYLNQFVTTAFMSNILFKFNQVDLALDTVNNVLKKRDFLNLKIYSDEYFSSKNRDLAFALLALEPFNTDIKREIVLHLKDSIDSLNSLESALTIRAIENYFGVNNLDFRAKVSIDDREYLLDSKRVFEGLESKAIKIEPLVSKIYFSLDKYHYGALPIKTKANRKLSIKRDYFLENGERADLNALKVGDRLFMQIDAKAYKNLKNVVIVMKYPSGFEYLNKRLDKNSLNRNFKTKNFYPEYIDIRDDRVLIFLNLKKETRFYLPFQSILEGEFFMPEIYIEDMYQKNLSDYFKDIEKITIKG